MAVLSVTGTESTWDVKWTGGDNARAFWDTIAARLPPADDPPIAILDRLIESLETPSETSHSNASQLSYTAAGQGYSGARLCAHDLAPIIVPQK
jgi:hypothetical protein